MSRLNPLLSRFPHIPAIFSNRNFQELPVPEPEACEDAGGYPPANDGDADGGGSPVRDGGVFTSRQAPEALHRAFDPKQVGAWDESRFKHVRKLQDATRNHGVVELMQDAHNDRLFAVKQMPNSWIKDCHEAFILEHPTETEMPWQDIGCTKFLNSVNFAYGCRLQGVYRNGAQTFVAASFATEGDLFTAAQAGEMPGPAREREFAPIIVQLLRGVTQLHDMQIVHRDVSLENVLLTLEEGKSREIRIIDYGMASTGRMLKDGVRGKASYQAPEMHTTQEYDAFLSDTFSVGVILYALLCKDYPWLSTRPGGCKCFEYVQKHGFRSYCAKRKVRGSDMRVADCISEDVTKLLEGMFAIDPAQRLTLGEKQWPDGRRSVWDEPFIQSCVEIADGNGHNKAC